MVVEIEVKVGNNALPLLAHLDLKRAHGEMASYMIREMGIMFETQGQSRGHPWVPLSKRYAARKRAAGKTHEILVRSGRLRTSFRPLRVTNRGFRFGTDARSKKTGAPYPVFHDSDEPRTSALPQRKLLRVLPRDLDEFANILRDAFERAAAQGGGSS
jgi:phage gpG-like protein